MEILPCFSLILPSTRKRCYLKRTKRQNACEIPLSLLDVSPLFYWDSQQCKQCKCDGFSHGQFTTSQNKPFPYSYLIFLRNEDAAVSFAGLPGSSDFQISACTLICCKRIGFPIDDWEFPSFSEIVLECWEKILFLPQLPLEQSGGDLGTGNYLRSFDFTIVLDTQEER